MPNRKRTLIPEDFSVSPQIVKLAKQNGWPDPAREIDAFRDHHLAKGSMFLDWEAAFRTWLRRAPQFGKGVRTPEPKPIRSVADRPAQGALQFDPRVREMVRELAAKMSEK